MVLVVQGVDGVHKVVEDSGDDGDRFAVEVDVEGVEGDRDVSRGVRREGVKEGHDVIERSGFSCDRRILFNKRSRQGPSKRRRRTGNKLHRKKRRLVMENKQTEILSGFKIVCFELD